METRKRSHSIDDDPVILKKHIISDENDSPHPNGVVTEQNEDLEPTADDKLELFRKEAIYRRMKHYSREYDRSLTRISELEERKNTCEAGLAAISACWMQLVDAIRPLVDSPRNDESGEAQAKPPSTRDLEELYELSTYVSEDSMPELKTALDKSRLATQDLVARLVQKGSSHIPKDVVFAQYQKVQTECAALRAQVEVLQIRLSDSEDLRDKLGKELAVSQNRVERLKSKTVQANSSKAASTSFEEVKEVAGAVPTKPSSPAPKDDLHGVQEHFEEVAEHRVEVIRKQDVEIHKLREEMTVMRLKSKLLTDQEISGSAYCQRLFSRYIQAHSEANATREELQKLKTSYEQYRAEREIHEENLKKDVEKEIGEYIALLARRDTDLVRLREERDQKVADLHERRSKENIKLASYGEYKSLATSRAERIAALELELRRCKLKLAANAGRDDIVKFLMETPNADLQYVEHLQARVESAESRAAALQDVYSKLHESQPDIAQHMQSEADALQQLSQVSVELNKYRTVYGDLSSAEPDLSAELQAKEEELHKLRLLNEQHENAESALYSEVEKLSSAWETLDSQVKSKVFDLSAMEERLNKTTVERAKADNKYYAAVKEKEALETEKKNLNRALERQTKAFEILKQAERALSEQVKAAHAHIHGMDQMYKKIEEDKQRLMLDYSNMKKDYRTNRNAEHEYGRQLELNRREWKILTDNLRSEAESHALAKKELSKEKLNLKSKAKFNSSRQTTKSEDPDAQMLSLLKCSTCNIHMRNTVITKCAHTFCRECVDARIASRQRKCPACGLGFAQSDVLRYFNQ